MALHGITRHAARDYVSDKDPAKSMVDVPVDKDNPKAGTIKEERIEEGATVFKLKPLDVFTMGRIYDDGMRIVQDGDGSNTSVATFANKTNIDAVKFGLDGWENFLDEEGNAIKFKTTKLNVGGKSYEVASDESLKALGIQLVQELGSEIKQRSEVSAVDEKK